MAHHSPPKFPNGAGHTRAGDLGWRRLTRSWVLLQSNPESSTIRNVETVRFETISTVGIEQRKGGAQLHLIRDTRRRGGRPARG